MRFSASVLRVLLGLGLILGCGYRPDPANGTVACAEGQCPSGYYCAANNRCWKSGQSPSGGADAAVTAPGLGGIGGMSGLGTTSTSPPVMAGSTATGGVPGSSSSTSPNGCSQTVLDCDGRPDNGCETNTTTDADNCGGCNKPCPAGDRGKPACSGGVCKLTCEVGYRDCDGDLKTGCESFISTDAKNCGRCGHDCAGGECKDGQCQPKVLISGQSKPTKLVVNDEGIYWINEGVSTNDGSVMRLDHGATKATTLASAQPKPRAIAVAGSVFWTNTGTEYGKGTIMQVSKTGGPSFTLASNSADPDGICSSGEWVVWTSNTGTFKRSLDNDSLVPVAETDPFSLICMDSEVYLCTVIGISRYQLVGGSGMLISKGDQKDIISSVVFDAGASLCFLNETCFGCYHDGLYCQGKWGTFGLERFDANFLATDGQYLYALLNGYSITRISSSKEETSVATIDSEAGDFAVFGNALYWTDPGNGKIWYVAKP